MASQGSDLRRPEWDILTPMRPEISFGCECGERLYFLPGEEHGTYRLRHGLRPEAVSPVLNGLAGERSFQWREQVHAYESHRQPL